MSSTETLEHLSDAQTTEEEFLRKIFVRAQMTDFVRDPLLMSRADGVYYWDVDGKQYLDALSGIYVVSVGHNNRRVIDSIRAQMDTMTFSPAIRSATAPHSDASSLYSVCGASMRSNFSRMVCSSNCGPNIVALCPSPV